MSIVGIAGVNAPHLNKTVLGVAGVDRVGKTGLVGIAGLDSPGIAKKALVGVAGNPGTPMRPLFASMSAAPKVPSKSLGDRVQASAWSRACYLSDWTYLVCPDPKTGGVRWRKGFEDLFSRANRRMLLLLDSASFRIFTGSAPKWATFELYLSAIDLIDPDGFMHMDVIGDQFASLVNYDRMVALGYGDRIIPVWQIGPSYDKSKPAAWNAAQALNDPIFAYYASRHELVAIGGMVKGPCPREARHLYFQELCRLLPDHRFWALGQASHMVVNGLGQLGLLDRVSTDGSWWIHHARTESIAVQHNGLIKAVRLEGTGMHSFFTLSEMMLCNLRSLLGAYAGTWEFPAPAPAPEHITTKASAAGDLKEALASEQPSFFQLLGIA